jgi:uncharacterized membrane protein
MKPLLEIHFSKKGILTGLFLWALAFFACALTEWNPFGFLYGIGVPFILFLPGILTLTLLNLRYLEYWVKVVLALALSLLEVMVMAFVGNEALPLFGVLRPLDTVPLVWEMALLILVLSIVSSGKIQATRIRIPKYVVADTLLETVYILTAFLFVVLSVSGAMLLNTGKSEGITMLMLLGMGIASISVVRNIEKLRDHVVPILLYCMSLALLLMTSLRGLFISGHDIQREFFVFQLAKDAGVWSTSVYVDAYNACLSITILPTLLANMLHMPDVFVYKVLFQIIFACSLIVMYLVSRTWLSPQFAFLTGLFFMAFPTFFQDMPFLTRQEIAFIFYGIMLYVLFEKKIALHIRQALFVCFGVGVILSHYSTTYTILFVLLLTSIMTSLVEYLRTRFLHVRLESTSALDVLAPGIQDEKKKISFIMVLLLFILSMVWTSVMTKTDGHVKRVVGDVWASLQSGFEGQVRSPDVSVLLAFGRAHTEVTLNEYIRGEVNEERIANPLLYYATSTYSAYSINEVPPLTRATTPFGNMHLTEHTTLATFSALFGNVLAKLIQLSIPLGMLYVLWRSSWVRRIAREFYLLSVSSMVFIGLCIVIPVLSTEYGIFRALQQSMFVLAPFMVVGTLAMSSLLVWLVTKVFRFLSMSRKEDTTSLVHTLSGIFGALFFFYATGFMGQMVGGNIPPVHLNNEGDEYNHYVVLEDEERAIQWLNKKIAQDISESTVVPIVQADRFGQKKLQAVLKTPVLGELYPGLIRKDAYVFVGPSVFVEGVAVVSYQGSMLKYTYPMVFLETQKELVYSNKSVRIYK